MAHDAAGGGGQAMGGEGGGRRRHPSARGGGGRTRGGGGRRSGGGGGDALAAPAAAPKPADKAEEKPAYRPKLLPQLTASVEIVLEDHPDVVIVPAQYVKFDQGKAVVEVAASEEDPKTREKREVQLGFSDGLRYEVKDGLK